MKAREEMWRLQAKLGCGDLPDNEPLFVLRAQDRFAAGLVRRWVQICAEAGTPDSKLTEAMRLADAMDRWPVKQTPGRRETRTAKAGPPGAVI